MFLNQKKYNDITSFHLRSNLIYDNVSAIRWRNIAVPTETSIYRNYAFRYDGLDRLLHADYGEGFMASNISNSGFDVTGLSYDKNGNILRLSRKYGGSTIDKLYR